MILILMVMLLVIILKIVIGSKVVYKDDYVVIEGQMIVEANSSLTKNINYPTNYNINNCVPISCGIKILDTKGYNYVGNKVDSGSILNNAYDRRLNLTEFDIKLFVVNPSTDSSKTITYKIVLMKV